MRSIAVVLLAAAAIGAPANDVATATVRTKTVEIAPNVTPQPFTVECAANQQLIGGGFVTDSRELRVISSFPGESGTWTVQVWNPAKTTQSMRLEANCLTGADGQTTVRSASARGASVRANCPDATVATGGGYSTSWTPRQGGWVVTGSHPLPDNGWGVETVPLPVDVPGASAGTPQINAYVLCLGGSVKLAASPMSQLEFLAGTPSCISSPIVAQSCTWPRLASQKTQACDGSVLSSTGFQVTTGALPAHSIRSAGVSEVTVASTTRDNSRIALLLTTTCLTWPPPPPPVPAGAPWPLVGGAAAALLLALLGVYWWRSKSKPGGGAGLDVVLTSQQSAFRLDRFREIP